MDSLFSKMTKAFSGEQKSPIGKNIGEKAAERYARRKEQYGAVGWTKKLNSIFSPEENDVESENVISNIKKDKRKKGAKLSPKEKNPNTNPLYTKITNQSVYPLRKGDSLADIAAKLFNFIKINADVENRDMEIAHNFHKEQEDESDARHKELLEVVKKTYSELPNQEDNKEDKKKEGRGLLGWLAKAGMLLLGVFETLGSVVKGLATMIIKPITKFLLTLTKDLIIHILPHMLEIFSDVLKFVGKQLWKVLEPALSFVARGVTGLVEAAKPLLSAAVTPLVVGLLTTLAAKFGLDKLIESQGGVETVAKIVELDKAGVIDDNTLDPSTESKVWDWDKIDKGTAQLLIRNNDFSDKDHERLTAISEGKEYKGGAASVDSDFVLKQRAETPSTLDKITNVFTGNSIKKFPTPPPLQTQTATPTPNATPAPAQIQSERGSDVVKKTSELNINAIEKNKEMSGNPLVMNNSKTNNVGTSDIIPGEYGGPLTTRNNEFDYILTESLLKGISGL